MAAHRSPRGRSARPSVAAGRRAAAHRTADRRAPGIAAAAALGAVAAGAFTALLPGGAAAEGTSAAPSSQDTVDTVLAASAGVLTVADRTAREAPVAHPLQPVAFVLDDGDRDAGTADRVASVEKAGLLAARLAEMHAQQQREQTAQARTEALIRGGGVDGWIAEALRVMDLPQSLAPGVKQIVMAESGGNPRAVNDWDSNARRGTPSRGLMQTIPSTFRAYVHPELAGRSIDDPVANITAGVRYMIDRYGIETLRSGGRSHSDGSYRGY